MQHQSIRRATFLILVLLITTAFVRLISDFLMACFWAVVLAVIFRNIYRRIRIRLRGRDNLAAFLSTIIILLVVMLPIFFVGQALIRESVNFYERIQSGEVEISKLVEIIEKQLPSVQAFLGRFGLTPDQLQERLSAAALAITQGIASRALSYTQNAINFAIQFTLMLYLLFFFFRDGELLIRTLIDVLPLGNRQERIFFNRFAAVTRATLKGVLIVAVIQGTIGGLMFWAVGIDGAIFWGVIMTLLSILPVGGSGIVWIPTAIILFIQGEIVRGIVVVIVGALIIGLVDNLLRPILVGRDTKMPDYLVLLSTLGGLTWFGLSGFVLGPVIASLLLACWEIVGREYGGRDL